MKLELVRLVRNRKELMTSVVDMSINTNVITFKTTHSDSFRKETIKIRIFILQINNKIIDTIETFEERKIRYIRIVVKRGDNKIDDHLHELIQKNNI